MGFAGPVRKGRGNSHSEIDKLSPRLAKAYANVSLRTLMRDVESLEKEELITRKGKKIRANQALIAQFLPICAHHPPMPDVGPNLSSTAPEQPS